jgi:hypothetical protein
VAIAAIDIPSDFAHLQYATFIDFEREPSPAALSTLVQGIRLVVQRANECSTGAASQSGPFRDLAELIIERPRADPSQFDPEMDILGVPTGSVLNLANRRLSASVWQRTDRATIRPGEEIRILLRSGFYTIALNYERVENPPPINGHVVPRLYFGRTKQPWTGNIHAGRTHRLRCVNLPKGALRRFLFSASGRSSTFLLTETSTEDL